MSGDEAIATPEEVLSFWFEDLTPDDWFRRSDEIDAKILHRFTATHLALARSVVPAWHASPEARLAAIIVLDQFPRNIYRATPLAFATDPLALDEARTAIDAGMDAKVAPERRIFFYLPFEHSETMEDQDRCIRLVTALGDADYIDYAERHRAVIAEYGRFPHRNPILRRESSPAEQDYLAQPGAGF